MKIYLIIAITAVLLFQNEIAAAGTKIPVKLVKILDGDTIKVRIDNNDFLVRLDNIDCFETDIINRTYKQAYENNISIENVLELGNYSKKYLINLYKNSNQNVYLDLKGVDVYSRALGIIYFDRLNVNREMKLNGGCVQY